MSRDTPHGPPISRKYQPNVSQDTKQPPNSSQHSPSPLMPHAELSLNIPRVANSPNHLTRSFIDLTLNDDNENEKEKEKEGKSPCTAVNRGLKRCADFENELQPGQPLSFGSKKTKEYITVSDHKTVEPPNEMDEHGILEIKVVIDMTNDEDDVLVIDDDDIVSSGDEVQVIGVRRRLREKRKQKVRSVKDTSKPAVSKITINGVPIERDSCVEFQDGTFMKVLTIYPDNKHKFLLVGHMFTRTTDKEVLMPRLRDSIKEWGPPTVKIAKIPTYLKGVRLMNEVYQRIKTAAGEADYDKGLWRRSALEVKRPRKLIMTNQPYEENCTLQRGTHEESLKDKLIESEGLLRCRWKETITTDEYGKVKQHKLHRPTRDEVLPEHFSTEAELRKAWRGSTLNLEASKTKPVMAEGFCGAGGMTSGATMAGFNVTIAFDADGKKITTHELNFRDCDSRQVDVTDWINWAETRNFKVDVVHLSPPCQPWSPANTTPNMFKNEQNQAVLLACGKVIESLRPRIVTIEESDGLTNRHSEWFGALLGQLTELDFSIRWASLSCSEFGVPQTRKRVFLIASA